jgi:hypothetical protein
VHVVRRERLRPRDTVVVVVLFHRRGDDAPGPDPVAAHDERLLAAVLVEEPRLQRSGETRLELEDVPDFDRHLQT